MDIFIYKDDIFQFEIQQTLEHLIGKNRQLSTPDIVDSTLRFGCLVQSSMTVGGLNDHVSSNSKRFRWGVAGDAYC